MTVKKMKPSGSRHWASRVDARPCEGGHRRLCIKARSAYPLRGSSSVTLPRYVTLMHAPLGYGRASGA
jgi:hypothetical protein